MPNIEKLLDVASNDIPAQFPKINRGVDIASEGLDLANTRLNDAQGYLTSAQQRVGDYQEAAGRAQEVTKPIVHCVNKVRRDFLNIKFRS